MHQVIGEALDFAGVYMEAAAHGRNRPVFPAGSAL
jgi:hypothetical protein